MLMTAMLAFADSNPPLQAVAHVDLARYTGRWYEIARYPNRFERSCVSDVTATYTQLPDGRIEVVNSCRNTDGREKASKGKAWVTDTITNAKLKVMFFWPFSGKYWVIDLAPDYSYAVVGEPGRDYLWILSRTPQMSDATYGEILVGIRQRGYDPGKLLKTPQMK
jgi:apolipoprotein D and lipocalin family protein